jgi:energy-coupling factor transport system permease protein
MKSLDQRGVPQGLSYVLASPLLLLEPISLRAKNIRDAQRARGLDLNGNWTARLLALPALVTPLITLALTDLDHRALVLNGRAFRARPRRTVLDPPPDSDAQRWFRRIVLIVAVLQIGLVRVWR